MKNLFEKLGARKYFTAVFTLFTACALVLAILISLIPSGIATIDTTGSKVTSLSKESSELVKSIETDVEICLIASTRGEENDQLLTLIQKYAQKGKHVKAKVLYCDENASEIKTYSVNSELDGGAVIVRSRSRSLYLPYGAFYTYSEQAELNAYNEYYSLYSAGSLKCTFTEFLQYYAPLLSLYDGYRYEEALNTAINYTASNNVKTAYYVSGDHKAHLVDPYFYLTLAKSMIEIKSVSLEKTDVPNDAAAVIMIVTEEKDISSAEKDKLSGYLNAGGSLTVMNSYPLSSMPNLASVCATLGITSGEGYVIEDTTEKYYSSGEYLLPSITDTDALTYLGGVKPLLPASIPVNQTDVLPDGVTVKEILSSSQRSFEMIIPKDADPNYKFDSANAERRAFSVAAIGQGGNGSSLTYYGSSLLLSPEIDLYSDYSNHALFSYILLNTCGSAPYVPTVEAKAFEIGYVDSTAALTSIFIVFGLALVGTTAFVGYKKAKR